MWLSSSGQYSDEARTTPFPEIPNSLPTDITFNLVIVGLNENIMWTHNGCLGRIID